MKVIVTLPWAVYGFGFRREWRETVTTSLVIAQFAALSFGDTEWDSPLGLLPLSVVNQGFINFTPAGQWQALVWLRVDTSKIVLPNNIFHWESKDRITSLKTSGPFKLSILSLGNDLRSALTVLFYITTRNCEPTWIIGHLLVFNPSGKCQPDCARVRRILITTIMIGHWHIMSVPAKKTVQHAVVSPISPEADTWIRRPA